MLKMSELTYLYILAGPLFQPFVLLCHCPLICRCDRHLARTQCSPIFIAIFLVVGNSLISA